jgi:hypothetical protein
VWFITHIDEVDIGSTTQKVHKRGRSAV